MRILKNLGFGTVLCSLIGCGSLEGDWESNTTCGGQRLTLELESDNKGDGFFAFRDGSCGRCDFEWEEKDGEVEIELENPCQGIFECDIEDDELDCDNGVNYERE